MISMCVYPWEHCLVNDLAGMHASSLLLLLLPSLRQWNLLFCFSFYFIILLVACIQAVLAGRMYIKLHPWSNSILVVPFDLRFVVGTFHIFIPNVTYFIWWRFNGSFDWTLLLKLYIYMIDNDWIVT